MAQAHYDLILKGGTCVLADEIADADIGIIDGKIADIGDLGADAGDVIDVNGLHVLPGVIDSQVHFREPGMEHKEDLATGTAAAALGGVTAICEMPNTNPSTTTREALEDKFNRAKGRAWCDHAFFVGAASENVDQLGELELMDGVVGTKIFMGSSTGSLLVQDDETLRKVLGAGKYRVAVHAEDEERLRERFRLVEGGADVSQHPVWRDEQTAVRATRRIIALARETKRPVHVLHITTADEIEILREAKDTVSVEVTPQHLTLAAPEAYERLGTLAQMNPPIRDGHHRDGLWKGLADGVVDVIGSDHAPHTLEEKDQPYPKSPAGMPGVQTLVPVMLDHVNAGRLSLERLVDLISLAPARLYGMIGKGPLAQGRDADFTVIDMKAERTITNKWIASRCGWTPFDGMKVRGWPIMTIVRGQVVMHEDTLVGDASGRPLSFQR